MKMPKMNISQCTVTLTRKCNLRCAFCYAKRAEYSETDTIKLDDLKRIVDFCNEAKVKYIIFSGGEPTLYPHLIDILAYIKSQNYEMSPTIATNGIVLKDIDFCNKLVENGMSYIDISLKGKDSKECCEIVGRDCFLQQAAAIRNLASLPIEFTCSMVLTPANVFSLCDTVKNAIQNGAKQFSFTFLIDNEKSKDNEDIYLQKNNPFALIDAFCSQIDKLNSITKEWWVEYSFPMCAFTSEQLAALKGKLACPCQIHTESGIIFDTDLNLIPCSMYIENRIGKLGVDFSSYEEFEMIAQKSVYRDTIDKLKNLPSTECESCQYLESCYGGCPVLWKNYSFDTMKKHKEMYVIKKTAAPEGTAANAQI
ncbi:MAG TPA: radical SAM protein [Ruminococcus flavefaciens]|nr:radical SAM protein [Ruminococcus flavefaciens]